MEEYSSVTNICINTIFMVSLILFGYLLYVVCQHSPITLGGYKYLLLCNLILSNICNFVIVLFKPIFCYVNCGILIQATGFGKKLATTFESTYCYLELSALALMLMAFSIFLSIFYRYQQMLPPSIEYWLNGIKVWKKAAVGIFVIFLVPNFIFLRLSRVDRELIEKEVLKEALLTTSSMLDEYQSYDGHLSQPLIVIYSGNFNFFFYVFLAWGATSLFVLFVYFALFHINIYKAMNETKARYLEETYRGQKLVFSVFSIQMAFFIFFLVLPIFIAALSAINLLPLPHYGYEILILLISFHSVLDAICVIYFIKAYRHFTFTLLQYLYKILRYKNSSKEFPWETSLKVLG